MNKPKIVCLCGSTRFWRTFQKAGLDETLAGNIVLSIGAASGTNDDHFGNLPKDEYDRIKRELDSLHLRKIDIADEVLILNVDGYIGNSTARELFYARSLGKPIRFLEPSNMEMERLLIVFGGEGSYVWSPDEVGLDCILEDIRILATEGSVGDEIKVCLMECEKGIHDRLPLD